MYRPPDRYPRCPETADQRRFAWEFLVGLEFSAGQLVRQRVQDLLVLVRHGSCYISFICKLATCYTRVMGNAKETTSGYLLISDFDQTLSFHDSGIVLSEMLAIPNFLERIEGLSKIHLVQQG